MYDGCYFLPIGWVDPFPHANILLDLLLHSLSFLALDQIIACSKICVDTPTGHQTSDELREWYHPVKLLINYNDWIWVAQS